jgi:prepilin-type N-terminal cleavage/methylation domain-containing protein
MKKNRGFTLIELIAVVVILGIVALISIPMIMNVIDGAKKGAFKNTAYGIIEAAKLDYAQDMLDKMADKVTFTYVDGIENSSVPGKKLDYKGEKPESGIVMVNRDGEVAIAVYDGKYCAEKDFQESVVKISEKTKEECTIIVSYADTSGASSPELQQGMIPIKWDGSKWIKADITNESGDNEWYDYGSQKWANIALVTNSTRANYVNAFVGSEIKENDIIAYFVWVPRYRYRLFNVDNLSVTEQKIEIQFEDKGTTKSNGSENGQWLTHAAFTFGTRELNGIWVGKFETTGTDSFPTIKPNSLSLTNQNVNNQFATSQLFNNQSTYGLTSSSEARMMKNTEWGAVAYLSQSDYGKYGNPVYTGELGLEKEVYINNINSYTDTEAGPTITGCAGDTLYAAEVKSLTCPITNQYTTNQGVKASTTGNIYGIYDMVGGSWEYIMGAMYNSDNTTIMISDSGFDQGTIDDPNMLKYIDKYLYGTTFDDQDAFNRRILGDATGETRGWNNGPIRFADSTYPWFRRGGRFSDGEGSGLFVFYRTSGIETTNYTFRTVITNE